MDKNQKTVLLWLSLAIVFAVFGGFTYISWKSEAVVHCPDGSTHPKIDVSGFATQYTGYSAKVEAKLGEKREFTAELGTEKLREMSEAIQQARLHMQALVAGYDACAVDAKEFNDARNRYQRMEDVAREVNEFAGRPQLNQQEEARLKQLVDQYIRLAALEVSNK